MEDFHDIVLAVIGLPLLDVEEKVLYILYTRRKTVFTCSNYKYKSVGAGSCSNPVGCFRHRLH